MTLANWVWLEAQISTNDISRQSATVAGWARPKAAETISAAGQMMSGCGLRGKDGNSSHFPVFSFPKKRNKSDTSTFLPIFLVSVTSDLQIIFMPWPFHLLKTVATFRTQSMGEMLIQEHFI